MSTSRFNPVRIIGGGFSGLTVAYYLAKNGVPVEVFEKSDRLGGLISTELASWGVVERAANGILIDSRVERLIQDLQINLAKRPEEKASFLRGLFSKKSTARYIFRSRARRWPLNFIESLRFFYGLFLFFINKKNTNNAEANNKETSNEETIEAWATRIFGSASFCYLIGPALQGLYGTTELSKTLILNALNRRRNFKNLQGSSGGKMNKSFRGTIAPLNGMQELIDGLASKICEMGGIIHLQTAGEIREGAFTVIATSAPSAALLLSEVETRLAQELSTISYLPLTTVTVGFDPTASRLAGFGCLFPKREGFNSLGVLFNSSIFSNRSRGHSETWIFNRADKNESELLDNIQLDRTRLVGVTDEIQHFMVTAWPHALPHYNFTLQKVLQKIASDHLLPKHIYLTGNYLGSIGLAKILADNEILANKIISEL